MSPRQVVPYHDGAPRRKPFLSVPAHDSFQEEYEMTALVATAPGQPISSAALDALRDSARGDVIDPSDPRYDDARRVYNALIDKRPALILQCADVSDVMAGVRFGQEQGLAVAVRGGGHNAAGLGTCDKGLVLDLSRMRWTDVDPRRRTVRVGGGAVWGDVDHATAAFGLATPSGIIGTTGVGGLTLGGGFGHLSRRYGLACDNLISADIVTADGSLVTASLDEHPDLFWAIRGGGGNFGVVTSFEFQLRPVDLVMAGPMFFSLDKAEELMLLYRDVIQDAPRELGLFFGYHVAPPAPFIPEELQLKPVALMLACYNGPESEGEKVIRPFREVGPLLDLVRVLPYAMFNSLFDVLHPPGMMDYWKADFDKKLTDEMIDIHLEHGPNVPTFSSVMHIYSINGAVQDVEPDETAFSYRDADFAHVILAMGDDPVTMPDHISWVKDYWNALHPLSAGGAYVNFLMDEGVGRVEASYQGNYPRLQQVKRSYDLENLFRVNQNIRPA
jgi:hypothetical protein